MKKNETKRTNDKQENQYWIYFRDVRGGGGFAIVNAKSYAHAKRKFRERFNEKLYRISNYKMRSFANPKKKNVNE